MARGQGRQANRVPPGMEFGQRQQMEEAQRAVPLPDRREQLQQAVQQGQEMPFEPVGLGAPTQRPGEPIMAGAEQPPGTMQQQGGIDPSLAAVIDALPMLEMHAGRDGASPAFRHFVFRLRSMVPPGAASEDLVSGA